ncbi:MAG: response regulator [Burkholderiales bacterium]|nr:response regulator [Burkholderiales bacterium]
MTRTLIVDDNAQNRYMLRMLLEAEGFVVEEAQHGGEALLKARQAPPDLVVSDLLMPVMDGYTLLRNWKSDPRLAAIPFVVYTATYVEPDDERLAREMGADAFLVKPAEPEAMLACVREVLGRARRGTASPAVAPTLDEQGLLARHNEVLVRKLEKRTQQLEQGYLELQESEERFRATFEQAAVGIAHVGLDGRFLRVNDKLCEITGYPREELLELDFAALTMPDDLPASDEARLDMLAGAVDQYAIEKRYLRKDGKAVWVNLVSTLLRGAADEPRYFISVIIDISERKLLEQQFQQAQKLESVGQLTGGIAHDFNNLLTVIIGNAEFLVEELAADESLCSLAEMIRTAAKRGADLTQRLLAFARRQALEPRVVDVNALLVDMDRMLRRMLPENIQISLVNFEGLWPAVVDAAQLEAAVLNLAINARDAMPEGGRLTVETGNVTIEQGAGALQADLSPGAYVMIAVSDTGTGIEPAILPRLFDPFFTTKPVGKGTGLGLSMVYGFAKQSRGHVKIYSELGQGTTVRLYLPRATDREMNADTDSQPGVVELHGGECILLVEDDELVRRFAERQLTDLGYRVVCAANGAEAMNIVRALSDIDLLLTDVIMPGGWNGPQLVEAARTVLPGLKVLFSSGYANEALVHGGHLDPGVNLLSKPYGRRELASKVRMVLGEPAVAARPSPRRNRLLVLDDDPMVAKVLCIAAERLGFEVEMTSDVAAFLKRVTDGAPSHVAIDLAMPGTAGVLVLDQLAEAGCGASVIIASGADAIQINAALARARAKGLRTAGALTKPFTMDALRALLND